MKENNRLRTVIKQKIIRCNVKNYFVDYKKPIIENDGNGIPYERDEYGNVCRGRNGEPSVDKSIVTDHAERTPGILNYSLHLLLLDEKMKTNIATSDNNRETEAEKMKYECEKGVAVEKRQQDTCAAQKEAHNKWQELCEKESILKEHLKVHALKTNLKTAQLNATDFHAFTSAFVAMEN